jgi:hypothetical protein
LGSVAALLALAACSLDWTVREAGSDAGADADAGGDAAEASAAEAATDAAALDADVDASGCAALAAALAAKQGKARECQIGQVGQCASTVNDACGCRVIVRAPVSPETAAYADGVAAFLAACGPPPAASCACPQLGVPGTWACLARDAGFACWPP